MVVEQARSASRPTAVVALLGANLVSEAGNTLTDIAVPWFVLQTTGSAAKTGLVGACILVSLAVAGILGGTLVDWVGFKRMSVLADVASGLTVALIPLLYATVGLAFWQLLALVVAGTVLDAPGATARQSLVPDLAGAGAAALARLDAAYQSVLNVANLVGPLLAGLLIAGLGPSHVLWLDAATFAISALVIAAAVPAPARAATQTSATPRAYLADTAAGLRFIRRDRVIVGLAAVSVLGNVVAGGITGVALLVYARDVGGGAAGVGVLYAAAGVGLLLGSLLYGVVASRCRARPLLLASLLLAAAPLWGLALLPGLAVATTLVVLRAAALGPTRPLVMTALHARVPAELRGRVLGGYRTLSIVAGPLGILLTSAAIQRYGLARALAGLATTALLVCAVATLNPGLRELDAGQRAQTVGWPHV